MAALIIAVTLFTFLLCWGLNKLFLVKYYTSKKQTAITEAYDLLKLSFKEKDWKESDAFAKFEQECTKNNIDWLLMDDINFEQYSNVKNVKILYFDLTKYMYGIVVLNREIIEKNSNYVLQKVNNESSDLIGNQLNFIEMCGVIDSANYFILQMPVEDIRTYADITNEFLGIIYVASLLISATIIWFIAKKATKPILELVDISKRMTNLDFEARYTSGGENEIGLLGQHFNQMSQNLEGTVSQLKSANNELQRDIEKKTEVDEMRKEFLSNVSHELKTPIALIQGYAEGLKEAVNDDEESKDFYCEVIMDEALKMNTMVKKLLSLNQIEFGNENISLERFDVVNLIDGIITSSDILIQQKNATIIFNKKDSIYTWGDEFKIEEVITNYLTNALNHLANENVIEIRVLKLDAKVRVSVFNTGENIPEDEVDKIWVKFYKVDKARTREYGGNGIGLSIVKAIMDSLNQQCGAINYKNGVEFWFELDGDIGKNLSDDRNIENING